MPLVKSPFPADEAAYRNYWRGASKLVATLLQDGSFAFYHHASLRWLTCSRADVAAYGALLADEATCCAQDAENEWFVTAQIEPADEEQIAEAEASGRR